MSRWCLCMGWGPSIAHPAPLAPPESPFLCFLGIIKNAHVFAPTPKEPGALGRAGCPSPLAAPIRGTPTPAHGWRPFVAAPQSRNRTVMCRNAVISLFQAPPGQVTGGIIFGSVRRSYLAICRRLSITG